MAKISIVIPYYNRLQLLKYTLASISTTKYADYEIILVNDAGDLIDTNIKKDFPALANKIKVIDISKNEKGDRTNPSVPFNKGLSHATGDIIVLQNPESYHNGDILSHISKNLKTGDYYVYSAYNLHSEKANEQFINNNKKNITDLSNIVKNKGTLEWYQHPKHRNCKFHFCSASHRQNFEIIGGFDEKYADGVCFDDDDMVLKMESVAKLNVCSIAPEGNPFIVNLYHPPSVSTNITDAPNTNAIKKKWLANEKIFNLKKTSINPEFEYPRIVYFFWYGKLTFLNYLSIISFHRHHPAWVINVYRSTSADSNHKWNTGEQKKFNRNIDDYFGALKHLSYVNIFDANRMAIELGIQNIYMVHQSDIIRMHLLNKFGGMYSDFDIIYTENIEKYFTGKSKTIIFNRNAGGTKTVYYPNALFLSKRDCEFCKFIVDRQLEETKNNKLDGYSTVGPVMLGKIFKNPKYDSIKQCIEIMDGKCYLPIEWNEVDKLYDKPSFSTTVPYFGIHWFNGAARSREYIESFDVGDNKYKCTMDKIVAVYKNELIDAGINLGKKNAVQMYYESIFNNTSSDKSLETVSGTGSTKEHTSVLAKELEKLIKDFNITSILDAGCGDLNWIKDINMNDSKYIGIDIVEDIILENKQKMLGKPKTDFYCMDMISDPTPCVDLIICRDTLVQFPNSIIMQTLTNFKKSGSKYILLTHFSNDRKNTNVEIGQWRTLTFTKTPFNFPQPVHVINEKCTECNGLYADKCMALWKLSDI